MEIKSSLLITEVSTVSGKRSNQSNQIKTIDHQRSGVVYNFGRICLSVCLFVCLSVRR